MDRVKRVQVIESLGEHVHRVEHQGVLGVERVGLPLQKPVGIFLEIPADKCFSILNFDVNIFGKFYFRAWSY